MLSDVLCHYRYDQQQRQQNNNQLQLNTRFLYGNIRSRLDGMTVVMVIESTGIRVAMNIDDMILNTDIMCLRFRSMMQMIVMGKQGQRQEGQDQQPADTLFAGGLYG